MCVCEFAGVCVCVCSGVNRNSLTVSSFNYKLLKYRSVLPYSWLLCLTLTSRAYLIYSYYLVAPIVPVLCFSLETVSLNLSEFTILLLLGFYL